MQINTLEASILRLNATFMQRKEFSFLPKNVQNFFDWSDRCTLILIFWWTTKLQILSRESSLSELTCCANKNAFALNLARLNERIASWLCCFSRWGVGPFWRGSHLSEQGQRRCSGNSHCAFLIMINLKGIQKWQRIWSGCGDCILASWHGPLASKQEYRSTSLLQGQYDELANLYLAICTYGGRCKKREVRPERSRLSRSCQ